MSGDVPVRICEGLEVKFLRSTHLNTIVKDKKNQTNKNPLTIEIVDKIKDAIQ